MFTCKALASINDVEIGNIFFNNLLRVKIFFKKVNTYMWQYAYKFLYGLFTNNSINTFRVLLCSLARTLTYTRTHHNYINIPYTIYVWKLIYIAMVIGILRCFKWVYFAFPLNKMQYLNFTYPFISD